MSKREMRNLIVEMLTDYNSNFMGAPCEYVVEEVLGEMVHKKNLTRPQAVEIIEYMAYNLYE